MNASSNKPTLLIAGLGNIGSHFVAELAKTKMPLTRAVLIDPDRYEDSNLVGQAIDRADVGKPKVEAQATKLQRTRPDLQIDTHAILLEAVPFGVYREAGVIISGLDSRSARAALNERVYRTGPARWIDGGVSPDAGLARVTVLQGGDDPPCLECDWTNADYAALERRYLCAGGNGIPSTAASAELGRLAAAGMMAALQSVLVDSITAIHRETLLQLDGGSPIETWLTRHPACRFHHRLDSVPDRAQRADQDLPLETFFAQFAPGPQAGISVHGAGPWVQRVACTGCGSPAERCLCLRNRLGGGKCVHCGSANLMPVGFESQSILWEDELSAEHRTASMRTVGLRSGDEITFYRHRFRPEPVFRLVFGSYQII